MGDQSKLVLLKEVVKTIREEGLLQRVNETGQELLCGLENIQVITCQIQPKGIFTLKQYNTQERSLVRKLVLPSF